MFCFFFFFCIFFVCVIHQLDTSTIRSKETWLDFLVVCFFRQIKIRCRRCAKIRVWQLRVRKDDPWPKFQVKQRKQIAARDRHLYRRKEKHQKIYTGFRFILQIADRGEREDKKDNLWEKPLKESIWQGVWEFDFLQHCDSGCLTAESDDCLSVSLTGGPGPNWQFFKAPDRKRH